MTQQSVLPPERLLTMEEVESLYGIPRRTLRHHRLRRCGLPWVKIGSGKRARVRYPKFLVDEYIQKHLVTGEEESV